MSDQNLGSVSKKGAPDLTQTGEPHPLAGLYDSDVYGWAIKNAELIRQGRFDDIDVENVAEEIESVGKSEKRALESRLTILLTHLLKWRFQSDRRGRSWQLTVKEQRLAVARNLRKNPSLKPSLDEIIADAYQSARVIAARETGLDENVFPENCPFSSEQVLEQSYLPD